VKERGGTTSAAPPREPRDPGERHQLEAATLWRRDGFGRERHLPGVGYWFENRLRDRQTVVLQYAVSGSIRYRDQAGRQHTVAAGQGLLFMHGEDTAYGLARDASEPFVTEFVSLCGAGLREHWALLRREGSILAAEEMAGTLPLLRRLIGRPAGGEPALEVAAEVHGLVLALVAARSRARAQAQSPVERAVDDLLRSPTGPGSLKTLAERHGVSREHLSRCFRARVGVSPGPYLAQERLARALDLLRQTALPVVEVARQAGFASTHTLARQVRAATGCSPRSLRGNADGG
jgi:AraC-like DNA-binding protein